LVFGLVAKDNGSTALMILMVSLAVMLVGQLSSKIYSGIFRNFRAFCGNFLVFGLKTDLIGSNRVHTWVSRIETFANSKKNANVEDETVKAKNYQVNQAKAAIVHGGITGIGPGKSALKQMLPQSASDFIFAIIVEEYGFLEHLYSSLYT
jgi:cell division protein FtsW